MVFSHSQGRLSRHWLKPWHMNPQLNSVAPPTERVDHCVDDFVRSDEDLLSREGELVICPGPSPAHSHTYMVREGHRECRNCRLHCCLMCVSDKNNSTGGFCIACHTGATDSNDPILKLSEANLWKELGTPCLVRLYLNCKVYILNTSSTRRIKTQLIVVIQSYWKKSCFQCILPHP